MVSTLRSELGLKNKSLAPTDAQSKNIYYNLSIKDVLSEDQFIEKMLVVRHRIINIFIKSIDPRTKKGIPGNYLMGVGPKIAHLRKFLNSQINHQNILLEKELPKDFKRLNDFWKNMIISKVVKSLINLQIDEMRESGNLWYLDQSGGVWEISQTLADETVFRRDEYLSIYNKIDNYSKPKYHDQRNYHGRPSQQSRRRNRQLRQAPGISTSIARNK